MTYNPQSRFQIVEGPLQQIPHKCACCGRSDNGKYVTWGLDVEFYGVVYLCLDTCMTEIANQFDYHSPAQWDEQTEIIKLLELRVHKAEKDNEELKNALAGLTRVLGVSDNSRDFDVPDSEPDEEERSDSVSESTPETESGSDEQDDESGSSDISSDDSISSLLQQFDI